MSILCVKLRRFEKNTLKGFVDLQLTRVGIVIRDCTWHRHPDGAEWVGFPARNYTNPETGEIKWQPLVEFAPGAKKAREEFRELALKAIHDAAAEADAGFA
jgi:hypothetical protein